MPTLPRLPSLALAAALLTTAAAASANGRFPAAGQIAVKPGDLSQILVRTTFGFVQTRDAGERWDWICEAAVGYGGPDDPSIGVTEDGSLIAGVVDGLNVSHDGGCDWHFIGGDLEERFVVDVSVEKTRPSQAIALVTTASEGLILTRVFESPDNGQTWAQAGETLPDNRSGLTLDAAPSDSQVLYVTARISSSLERPSVLLRSLDRGGSWEELPIPGTDDKHAAYLGAVDPADPQTIYVRLDGVPTDSLLVSHDGGQSFQTVFEAVGDMLSFALSPDGSRVLLGGPTDGIWGASADNLLFEKVSDVGPTCLTWADTAVFACGDQFKGTFTIGRSDDEGKTFETLMLLADPCGPLECPDGTSVAQTCDAEWTALKDVLGAGQCDAQGAGGGAATPGDAGDDTGCGCRAAGAAPLAPASAWLFSAGALIALSRRRRR